MPGRQNQAIVRRIEEFRENVRLLLRNKLTYPKTVRGVLRDRKLTEDKLLKMQDCIDESIRLVDARFDELLTELNHK